MLFKFDVPVIGALYVLASSAEEATAAGRAHISPFIESAGVPANFTLGEPERLPADDLPADADPNFVIDSAGMIRDDLIAGPDAVQNTAPATGNPGHLFVGKVVFQDGSVRFFRVNSPDTSQARATLESRFGPPAVVQLVSTPDFLFENDTDFVQGLQNSRLGDVDAFVQSLDVVVPTDSAAGKAEQPQGGETHLPVDVQEFPFASFQNAVAGLGLDPEGALGSTVSRRYETLAPVARIGSLTGSIDTVGQSPGALERFFSDRFGDLDIAAETFRDLLAGRTGSDAMADQLLAFRALQDPDVATSQGRADAADVFRLARAAAADRFGSFVASRLLPSNARLFRELERQLAAGDPSTDFLQFARQQNLLPI